MLKKLLKQDFIKTFLAAAFLIFTFIIIVVSFNSCADKNNTQSEANTQNAFDSSQNNQNGIDANNSINEDLEELTVDLNAYKYESVNPIDFNINDTMNYICEYAFTKEHILNFDVNAYYFGPLNTGIYAGNDIFIVSEDRSLMGIDGILIYSGGNNSDNSLGSFNFIIPNATLKEYKKIIEGLKEFIQQDMDIAYYEENYFRQKVKEIPEGDNHYPSFKLLIQINDVNDILSIYNIKDENTIINNSELNVQTDNIKIPTPRESWQDWQDFYSISVWWGGEDIVKQRFTDILPWHKNDEKIYNELYICIHYPLA